jgi:diguanylate cyclase (GGDEF)-like protein
VAPEETAQVTTPGAVSVLLVGLEEADGSELAIDDAFTVRRTATLEEASPVTEDAVVVALDGTGPLERLREARAAAPAAAVIVVTDAAREADGAIALHAGAEDHLVRDGVFAMLLPRAVRYAVALRTVRRDLATIDEVTSLPNLRGFASIAEHHLRMSDRTQVPAIFVFVRLDGFDETSASDPDTADDLARDAAAVVLEAVRDADVPARVAPDTIVVLLAGAADGTESIVLSRLVEAMAVHDAARGSSRSLSLSVGTARYEPGSAGGLSDILSSAFRGLASRG